MQPDSSHPSERAERKTALRSRIIEAALELFAERGFHGTTIPDVMKQAAVGAGSLYRLFESKEARVNAVFQAAKGKLAHALTDGLSVELPPRALFDDIWRRLSTFAIREPKAFRFLELQDHTLYLDRTSRGQELAVLAPIAFGCVEFQQRGVFRSDVTPDVIIAFIWGAFVGLVKAARLGYLPLGAAQLTAARDACFRAFAPDSVNTTFEPQRLPPTEGAEDGSGATSPARNSGRTTTRGGDARSRRSR